MNYVFCFIKTDLSNYWFSPAENLDIHYVQVQINTKTLQTTA